MAGLTTEGFTPSTLTEIQERIKIRLDALSPGFDFSPESPDGQMIEVMSLELSQAWNELALVYKSYDPNQATGAGLRNIGLITGIVYGAATRSQATIQLVGVADTLVQVGSIVTDADGNEFITAFDALIPSSVQVISPVSGAIPVTAGTITTIKSPITGWTSITQVADGRIGATAQTEQAFRNVRNRTVLRNYIGTPDVIQGRLYELGLVQVSVVQNDDPVTPLPDGTPANHIHVTIHADPFITDEDVARVILESKPSGIPTYGATAVVLDDSQGNTHTINFDKATAVNIYMNVDVTFLDDDFAGAQENIINDLVSHITSLQVGEDVIHSRLYSVITPWGKAQVNVLEIGKVDGTETAANVVIAVDEFAFCDAGFIDFTVT
ncbi:MAG: hypothetical protein KAS32_08325 [Candidatus Peribacteraceae bacterium]|nr:hypothetical protein [Candidatus Peribacteraceae bacterium]